MSRPATVRILPAEEIAARAGGVTPFLVWPQRATLFAERAMRLLQRSRGHAMGDYLAFAAGIASAQHDALATMPSVPVPDGARVAQAHAMSLPPLPARDWSRDVAWQVAAASIAAAVAPTAPPVARARLDAIAGWTPDRFEAQADAILERTPVGLDVAAAPIVAAALQVYWTHLLLALRERFDGVGEAVVRVADETRCPACGSLPTASITRSGGESLGQRYLHCSLCSLQWHLPRSKCPHCLGDSGLAFQSLDAAQAGEGESRAAQASIQAETCDLCHHYLKIVHTDRDPQVDPVADDLASLTLDLLVVETGMNRHGVNDLLLFGDPPDPDGTGP